MMSRYTIEPRGAILADLPGSPSGLLARAALLPGRALDLLYTWQSRASERTHLASLDDRLLRDMGLSRADVDGEVHKPFWQA